MNKNDLRNLRDNTNLFIHQLSQIIQEEIKEVLEQRFPDCEEFNVYEAMCDRVTSLCDNDIIMYEEVLKWSNNISIYA